MADKKKKLAPVTSNLKEDVDAAINEAAAEIVAESITQKAIAAVMDKSDEVVANTVTDVLEIVEEDETTGSVRGRLKKRLPKVPGAVGNGRLVLDSGLGELSTPHDKVKDALETYPLVSIYGIELKPLPEKVTLGEIMGYDSVLSNYTRNVHRMVRYLPVDLKTELYHFAFVLNGTTTHLYIADSSYVVNDKNNTYYYANNKNTFAAAIVLNSKLFKS